MGRKDRGGRGGRKATCRSKTAGIIEPVRRGLATVKTFLGKESRCLRIFFRIAGDAYQIDKTGGEGMLGVHENRPREAILSTPRFFRARLPGVV